MTLFKWTHKVIEELIELYRLRAQLYDTSHPEYANKRERLNALKEICQELKRVNNSVIPMNAEDIKHKINSLRCRYVKQMKEHKARRKTGSDEDDRYLPKLWFFDQMNFLEEHCSLKKLPEEYATNSERSIICDTNPLPAPSSVPVSQNTSTTVFVPSPASQTTPASCSTFQISYVPTAESSCPPPPATTAPSFTASSLPATSIPAPSFPAPSSPAPQTKYTIKKIKLSSPYRTDEPYSSPYRSRNPVTPQQAIKQDWGIHKCATCPCIAAQENEYDKIGKTWGSELQKMTSDQQIFAKRAIAEILFEGQLGTLHRNSVMISHIEHDVPYDVPRHEHPKTEHIDECI